MAQETVEIVRSVFRGWNEDGIDGMLPFFHDDIEYLPMEERGVIHGHDGLRRYFDRWMDAWDELRISLTEIIVANEQVFNGITLQGRGHGSGVEVTMEFWQVWRFREGRAVRWEEYPDRSEALEAAGLSE